MKVVLRPGERVEIELADTDGRFVVAYGRATLRVTSDLPDTKGRKGVIYEERFRYSHNEKDVAYSWS